MSHEDIYLKPLPRYIQPIILLSRISSKRPIHILLFSHYQQPGPTLEPGPLPSSKLAFASHVECRNSLKIAISPRSKGKGRNKLCEYRLSSISSNVVLTERVRRI